MAGICEVHFVPNCIICNPRSMSGNVVRVSAENMPKPVSIIQQEGTLIGTTGIMPVVVPPKVVEPRHFVGDAALMASAGDTLAAAIQNVVILDALVQTAEKDLERLNKERTEAIKFRDEARRKLLDLLSPLVVQSEIDSKA